MLLEIPGDNTYASYKEANAAFWRGTVLPLTARIAGAISAWLAPAYGEGLRLWPIRSGPSAGAEHVERSATVPRLE